jgi:GLPGLI family protein
MKKLVLISILISLGAFLKAQITEGKIIFKQQATFKIDSSRFEKMTEERRQEAMKRIKEFGRQKMVLVFNQEASLYRDYNVELDATTDEEWENNKQQGWWMMFRPKNSVYVAANDTLKIEQKEFFGKLFLIKNKKEQPQWKMTGKQETIAGHLCMNATYQQNDTTFVSAWFTMQIPVSTGPLGYSGLPGTILKVDINNGEMLAEAVKILEVTPEKIEEPTKGKEVTDEEYREIVRQKMKEMREMYGKGAGKGFGH